MTNVQRRLGRPSDRAEQAPHGVGLFPVHKPPRAGTAGTDEDFDREPSTRASPDDGGYW